MNFAIAKTPHSFTLLTGNDTISREKARDDIIAAVQERAGQAEIERFDPEAHSSASFTERIITPSLFQTVRVFLVLDAHTLSREDLENLSGVSLTTSPTCLSSSKAKNQRAEKAGSARPRKNSANLSNRLCTRPKNGRPNSRMPISPCRRTIK
jgi:DNA polymerase III delta subunit